MKKYIMAWTTNDGTRIENQIYTASQVSNQLKNLEKWGAYDITLKESKEETS